MERENQKFKKFNAAPVLLEEDDSREKEALHTSSSEGSVG